MSHYWTTDDLHAGRCLRGDLGLAKPAQEVVELTRLDTSPEGIVRAAVQTLLLAAQQTRDLPSAVKAAASLLRYYAPPQRAPLSPDEKDWPAFMDKERLSYRLGTPADGQQDAQEARSALEPPLTPTQPEIASAAPPRPQLHAVAPTTWFDAPSRPAS